MKLSKETVRIATKNDIPFIMEGIAQAKMQLRSHQSGQWQFGEPSEKTIQHDVELQQYWVLIFENVLIGGCALLFHETAYDQLHKGQWLNNDPYGVIHRFYIHPKYQQKAFGIKLLHAIETKVLSLAIHNVRIDTHERNIPMRKMLEKMHYQHVGEAWLFQAGMRFVYHKVI